MRAMIWCATHHCSILDDVSAVDPLVPLGLLLFTVFLAIGVRSAAFQHAE